MVLGPVKLDATTDPGTRQTHQCRLNHMVIIHKVALFYLVVRHLDTSTQFWQHHHLDIFVLQIDGLPLLVHLLVRDRLNDRIGIHHPTRALIYSVFQEYRVLLWFPNFISRNRHYFSPSFYHGFLFFATDHRT